MLQLFFFCLRIALGSIQLEFGADKLIPVIFDDSDILITLPDKNTGHYDSSYQQSDQQCNNGKYTFASAFGRLDIIDDQVIQIMVFSHRGNTGSIDFLILYHIYIRAAEIGTLRDRSWVIQGREGNCFGF